MDERDITFIVHRDWLTAIKDLDVLDQDAVIGDLIRYGVELEPQHADNKTITAMVNLVKGKIDYSKSQYAKKVESGKNAGKKKRFSDKMIYEVAKDYPEDAQKVADILGCSKSTVDHSEGWRRRKEENAIFVG